MSLAGLVNLKRPEAIRAGLLDRDEPIQIYVYELKHPKFGNFLVDTGVSQKLSDDPGNAGINWLIQRVMHIDQLHIQKNTAQILQGMEGKLSGVFLTHLHLDHLFGMSDIPDDVPIYSGAAESSAASFKNLFVRGATDTLLENKQPIQEWHPQPDPQHKFEGIVDIFEDGSVFAISVPGHTQGSTAFLVRTTTGPVLLTGDTSHTHWGWDQTVEPGDFTEDHERNLENLKRLKQLVADHPMIEVRLGHQH